MASCPAPIKLALRLPSTAPPIPLWRRFSNDFCEPQHHHRRWWYRRTDGSCWLETRWTPCESQLDHPRMLMIVAHHTPGKLLERSESATAFGAAIVIGQNAVKVLNMYDMDYEASHMSLVRAVEMVKGDTLQTLQFDEGYGGDSYFVHRVDLCEGLTRLAIQEEGAGPPVEIIYSSPVQAYNGDTGAVQLENGTWLTADLVVAADGVGSIAPRYVLGHDCPVKSTGSTVVRFMLPTESITSDPITAPLIKRQGQFSIFIGTDHQRWMLRFPCRNETLQHFSMYSLQNNDFEAEEHIYRFKCDRESLRRELSGFHESVLGIVPKTTEILPVWKCSERKPLQTWCKGRVVLIGDASHPMLPNQGQGAGMSIEDAGALGVMLRDMPDASMKSISERIALFEKVRRPRASVVQIISSEPFFADAVKATKSECQKYMPAEKLAKDSRDLRLWLTTYDVVKESWKCLNDTLGHKG